MKMTIKSNSPEDTRKLGIRIGSLLQGNDILLLEGELGSGKTLLTKGLYLGLGGPDDEQVRSPSYTLVHNYEDASVPICHADLFRLEKADALAGLNDEADLFDNAGLTVIEWPKGATDLLAPETYLTIQFSPGSDMESRTIELSAQGPHYQAVFEELAK